MVYLGLPEGKPPLQSPLPGHIKPLVRCPTTRREQGYLCQEWALETCPRKPKVELLRTVNLQSGPNAIQPELADAGLVPIGIADEKPDNW